MYGIIHAQIFDSSLRDKWQAWVTLVALIALADKNDEVDMTVQALMARTGLPGSIIPEGIAYLEQPDEHSRSPEEGGRRIVRLDEHRPWGWRIVNRAKYKRVSDYRERTEYFREQKRKQRATHMSTNCPPLSTNCPPQTRDKRQETRDEKKNLPPRAARANIGGKDLSEMELPPCVSREVWRSFVEHRKSGKGKLTPAAAKLALSRLTELHSDGHDPKAVVEQSILSGWTGVFPLKNGSARAVAAPRASTTKRQTCIGCSTTRFVPAPASDWYKCNKCKEMS